MWLLGILIAVGIGYAVTIGVKGHMAPAEGDGAGGGSAPDCMALFDKLPAGSGPDTDLRAAAKKAWLYGTKADATSPDGGTTPSAIDTLGNHLDDLGYGAQAMCLHQRAAELRNAPTMIAPGSPTGATGLPTGPGGGTSLMFPMDTAESSAPTGFDPKGGV